MPTNETSQTTQRTVNQLLSEFELTGTYQNMTDEEIQSLVDYWKQLSYNEGSISATATVFQQHSTAVQAATETALQAQTSMLESIINRATNLHLETVHYG